MPRLNPEQKKAVQVSSGPLLIIAGPGTGKTTVLANRLAYLIQKRKIAPDKILALTFTRQAAQEMEERTDQLLPFSAFDLKVGTFHSLGEDLLKEYGLEIGLPINFRLLEEKGSWLLMRRFWERFNLPYYQPLADPGQLISSLLTHFSRCKDEGITPEKYFNYWKRFKEKEKDRQEIQRVKDLAQAYKTYQSLLLENQALDFGDLINFSHQLLEKRPKILENLRQRWSFILVDEFQDTNWAQYQLLKLLAPPQNNLTVCASEDQAIYQWRGASYTNILQFKKDYPQSKVIVLRNNYRSRQEILDFSYRFIQMNNPNRLECQEEGKKRRLGINNQLQAIKKGKAKIEVLHFLTGTAEVRGVVKKIQSLLEKTSPNEIAILARTHQSLRPFEKLLRQKGVPSQLFSPENLYQQSLIIDLLSYFRLLENSFEDTALYRVLKLPFWRLPNNFLARLLNYHQRKGQSLFQSLEDLIPRLPSKERKRGEAFLARIEEDRQRLKQKKLTFILTSVLEETGWLKWLLEKKEEKELTFLNDFYQKLEEFETEVPEGQLYDFLLQVERERKIEVSERKRTFEEEGPESVKLMTVHAAKGLEFENVFLVNLVDRRFPSDRRKEPIPFPKALIQEKTPQGDLHLQEERRLFYVAMTRAKKNLFFTWAEDYGQTRKKKASRFLQELKIDVNREEKGREFSPRKKKTISSKEDFLFKPKYFSFTQIRNFQTCPQQYKFTHLLKLPSRGGPDRSFGQSLHKTLELFLRAYTLQSRFKFDWSKLLSIYEENWLDDWYESKKQEKEFFSKGKKQLKNFFKDFQKNPPQVFTSEGQAWLEKDFSFSLDGYPFKGKIDRVDKKEDGLEIIDYKTGKPHKRLTADLRRQLLLYQIAVEEAFQLFPKQLTFYYLQDGSKLSFLGQSEEKEKVKKEVIKIIKEIEKGSFPPRPGYHCRYCDYRQICEKA
jgi:DNA helicase II / ATP-dependent DNA helicase PcrA